MSNSMSIKIEGVDFAEIYIHNFNSKIERFLIDFNRDFEKNRNNDPEYKFAQLLRHSYTIDDSRYLGWGVIQPYNTNKYILGLDGVNNFYILNK